MGLGRAGPLCPEHDCTNSCEDPTLQVCKLTSILPIGPQHWAESIDAKSFCSICPLALDFQLRKSRRGGRCVADSWASRGARRMGAHGQRYHCWGAAAVLRSIGDETHWTLQRRRAGRKEGRDTASAFRGRPRQSDPCDRRGHLYLCWTKIRRLQWRHALP